MDDLLALAMNTDAEQKEQEVQEEEVVEVPDLRKDVWENGHNLTTVEYKKGFTEGSQVIVYKVGYLETENKPLRGYLGRATEESEEAYLDFLHDGVKEMAFFPAQLPKIDGKEYQADFVQAASVCMSFRVRRLLVSEEIRQLEQKMVEYYDLKDLCAKKKAAHANRVLMLERELDEMLEEIKYKARESRYMSPFSALLSNKDGTKVLTELLNRECRRLQADTEMNMGEDVDESLELEDIVSMFELFQYYTLFNSIKVRARNGNKHYPVNGRADGNKVITKGRQPGSAPVSARSTGSASGKDPKSLKPGDMKKLKDAARRGASAKGEGQGMLDNDDSTIASETLSLSTKGTLPAKEAPIPAPEQKKGGWGFGSMVNWISGKKEEVVEDTGPAVVKLVPFCASGNDMGAFDWLDVCAMMGTKRGDQTLRSACRGALELLKIQAGEAEEGEEGIGILNSCVPRVLRNDFTMGINELGAKELTSPIIEAAAHQISQSIADELKKRAKGALRNHDKWCTFLEGIRKDRIRRSGGNLKEDQEGQVEVDKQGTIRVIPNSDKIVDTDIVHGSKQRLQISVVEPVLISKIDEGIRKLRVLKGECACLVQFGYTYMAPYVQRAIRGTLGRMRRNTRRKDTGLFSMHAAVTTIQTWLRGKWGKTAYARKKAELMGNVLEDVTIYLQAAARMGTMRIPYLRRKRAKAAASEWFAVTKFQAMIRGFNARHRYTKFKEVVYAQRDQETKYFSVGLLQRWARGCIARRTIVKSLKVRKTIDKDLLLKAEKYLQGGDLWSFLKQINDDVTILKKTIADNQKAEDEFAATFVNKVIARRQGEYDGAWDDFSKAVKQDGAAPGLNASANPNDALSSVSGGEGEGAVVSKSLESAVPTGTNGAGTGPPGITAGAGGGTRPISPTKGGGNIPGPMLRRAVSATIQEGMSREMRGQSRGSGNKQQEEGQASGAEGKVGKVGKVGSKRASGSVVSSKKKGKGESAKAKPPVKRKGAKLNPDEERERGKVYSSTTDWAWAQATGTEAEEEKKKEEVVRKPHIGESLLVDIPKGIDDTIERIIHAASIKCFIPEFSNCETADEAYALYCQMPSGLAKMRFEVEARRWTQPSINKLRVKGIVDIKDALPMNKLKQYIDSVDLPVSVQLMVIKWVRILKDMGDLVHGKVHGATAKHQQNLKKGQGTAGQLASVSLKHKKLTEALAEGEEESKSSPSRPGAKGSGSFHQPGWTTKAGAGPMGTPSAQLEAAKSGKSVDGGVSIADPSSIDLGLSKEERAILEKREKITEDMLQDFISQGTWARLQASCEDFLLHAAFLVVPHVEKDPGAGEDLKHGEMGQMAFKAHMKELDATTDPDAKREIVRNRFREALLFCTPYTLRLRAMGILTVLDLLTKSEAMDSMNFPPIYHTQVESLLSVAVGASASAKSAPLIPEAVKSAPEVFKVPMLFDPKYQRSPFDPYGQPPRYIPPVIKDPSLNDKLMNDGKGVAEAKTTLGASSKANDYASKPTMDKKTAAFAKEEDDEIRENGLFANEEEEIRSPVNDNTRALFKVQVQEKDRSAVTKAVVEVKFDESKGEAQADFYKKDFESRVRAGFERPFKCKHPGCNEAFSRAYTLKIHEKSHKVFGNYHKWKKEPQLGLDLDRKAMRAEAINLVEERSRLPPIVQAELKKLTKLSKTYNVSGTVMELEGPKEEVPPYEPRLNGTEWPQVPKAKATLALETMHPYDDESRPTTGIYHDAFFPPRGMSPGLDSASTSRATTRGLQSNGGLADRGDSGRNLISQGGTRVKVRVESPTFTDAEKTLWPGVSRGASRGASRGMTPLEPMKVSDFEGLEYATLPNQQELGADI